MATKYKAWTKEQNASKCKIYDDGKTPAIDTKISLVSAYIGNKYDAFLYAQIEENPCYMAMINNDCKGIITAGNEENIYKLAPTNLAEDFMSVFYNTPKLITNSYNILDSTNPDIMRILDDTSSTASKAYTQVLNNKSIIPVTFEFNILTGILINHTKRCYINLADYSVRAIDYHNKKLNKNAPSAPMTTEDAFQSLVSISELEIPVLSPLQYLIAVGNENREKELGYDKKYINYDKYGSWAFDLISFTKDYDEIENYHFHNLYEEDFIFSYIL